MTDSKPTPVELARAELVAAGLALAEGDVENVSDAVFRVERAGKAYRAALQARARGPVPTKPAFYYLHDRRPALVRHIDNSERRLWGFTLNEHGLRSEFEVGHENAPKWARMGSDPNHVVEVPECDQWLRARDAGNRADDVVADMKAVLAGRTMLMPFTEGHLLTVEGWLRDLTGESSNKEDADVPF